MDFRERLRAEKSEGEREWFRKQAEERGREAAESARIREEEEKRRSAEAEKDRIKAEAVFATLPEMVRQAAAKGLRSVVLAESFLDERPDDEVPSHTLVLNRRTYYLKGWQIPFYTMCKEAGVPLTVVSEKVDVGLKRLLHHTYNVLAIDLEHL